MVVTPTDPHQTVMWTIVSCQPQRRLIASNGYILYSVARAILSMVGLGFPLLLVAWHLQQLCATATKARHKKKKTGLLWWHTLQCQVPSQSRRSSFDVEIATSIMASLSLATRRKGMSTIRLLDQQKRQMISTDWLWATLPHLGKLEGGEYVVTVSLLTFCLFTAIMHGFRLLDSVRRTMREYGAMTAASMVQLNSGDWNMKRSW